MLTNAEKARRYRARHPERVKVAQDVYGQKVENKARRRAYSLTFSKRAKKAAYDLLGTECVRCGFSDPRALQIDHIEGKGHQQRKAITKNFYRVVVEEILSGENKYQILCANCNWIKRSENNEYKKQ